MNLHTLKAKSPLNIAVDNYFTTFKTELLSFATKQWNEEDIKGKSDYQWKVMQYYDLMYLLILVYVDIERTKNLNKNWDYYVSKFDLNTYRECIACQGISWKKAIEAFSFQNIVSGVGNLGNGIEEMEVENSFIIQSESLTISTLSSKELLSSPVGCTNYID